MKHEIKLLGCWHVAIFVASLILSLILIYVTLNLNSGLTNLNLRYQELVTQTDLYQKVLADKTNLKLAIDHIQQDIYP